jgi:general secretion pathway protein M
MMAIVRRFWRDRSVREQWLLGVAGVLLLAVLAWLAVLRPLASAQASAATRRALAVTALGDVRAMAGAIRAAEARGRAARAVPLVELVGRRATEAGVTPERLESSGDGRVSARIAAIKPAPLLRWLEALERRDGVIIDQLGIVRNPDATVAAELALRAGGN